MPDRLTPDQLRQIRARYSRRETEDTRYSPTAIDVLSAIADDVPALLAEIEALRADVTRLRETLEVVVSVLGDPRGYCDADRSEVGDAVYFAHEALDATPTAAAGRADSAAAAAQEPPTQ